MFRRICFDRVDIVRQVPTEFFVGHLGPYRKYSSCEWDSARTLADAETKTFDSYLEKVSEVSQ
jgi:cyclopropane fatty-acyl-phospholipid synthase-like methyltransferase